MAREDMNSRINRHLVLSRMLFFIALGLTIAGGVLEGSDTLSDVEIGVKLVKAGYSLVVLFVACLLAIQVSLWTRYSWLSNPSQTVSYILPDRYQIADKLTKHVFFFHSDPQGLHPRDPFHNCPYLLPLPLCFLSIGSTVGQSDRSNRAVPLYGSRHGILRCGPFPCHRLCHSSYEKRK